MRVPCRRAARRGSPVKIQCRALAELDAAQYDRLVAESFFASRGFLGIWSAMGGSPMVWTAEQDGRLAAVLPGVEYRLGPIARFISQPDGCYGGMFLDPAFAHRRDEAAAALLGSIASHNYTKCVVFDYARAMGEHPEFDSAHCETRLVRISGEDWLPENAKLQSEIRRAARLGLEVERFDYARHQTGLEDLIQQTAKRHGVRPRYRMRLFQKLAAVAATDTRVRWRHCAREGKPVASQIYFVERGALVSWQDYSCRAYSTLKPNQFIRWELCRQVASEGIEWLNLGASPLDAEGLDAYKTRWGGTAAYYSSLTRWSGVGSLLKGRARRGAVPV